MKKGALTVLYIYENSSEPAKKVYYSKTKLFLIGVFRTLVFLGLISLFSYTYYLNLQNRKLTEYRDAYLKVEELNQKVIRLEKRLNEMENIARKHNVIPYPQPPENFSKSSPSPLHQRDIRDLETAILSYESATNELLKKFEKWDEEETRREQLLNRTPSFLPCKGKISSTFGFRIIFGKKEFHKGWDISTPIGTPVYATAAGVVAKIEYQPNGLGLLVVIDHLNQLRTIYGHLSRVLVKEGELVEKGQLIAKTGNSGLSTAPHLHYQIEYKGVALNPAIFAHVTTENVDEVWEKIKNTVKGK